MPQGSKVIGLLLLLLPTTAWAQERQLQFISDDLDALGRQINDVSQSDLSAASASQHTYQHVFDQAEMFFVLGDHAATALLLYPLLQTSEAQNQPTYDTALYYLGDSQAHIGNHAAARTLLRQVVSRGGTRTEDAVRSLIQLGDRTADWTGVDEAVAARRARGPLPADIAYDYAKSLLVQKRPDTVEAVINDIPHEHRTFAKARYLVGVAAVERKDYDAAEAVFAELRAAAENYDDASYVRDICTLNHGRLLLEKGQPTDAVNAYAEVPRQSKLFDDALYETIWTYLRQAEDAKDDGERNNRYANALEALEIFLLSDEHPDMEPEARILLGNILSRQGRVDEAQQVFLEVVDRYSPMRDHVSAIKATTSDPVPLFVPHGASELAAVSPLVASITAGETRLKRALNVSKDMSDSQQWLKDSTDVLQKLWAALNSGGSLSFFPGLRDLSIHKVTLESQLVRMMARLVDVEAEVVRGSLDATQATELQNLLAQRAALEEQRKDAPLSQEEYERTMTANVDRLQGAEQDITKLRWMIEEQRRAVASLYAWLQDNPTSLDPASRQTLESGMKTHNDVTDGLETARLELMQSLDAQRSAVKAGVEDPRLQTLRRQYMALLDRERELLDGARARVPADERTNLERVDLQRSKITANFAALNAMEKKISEVLAQHTLERKADLLAMQHEIEQRRHDLESTRPDATSVVQTVAGRSLQRVQKKLNEIVMRGDVGLVDVAWQLKEEETREISRRVNAQHNELEILDNEYREVLAKDSKDTKEAVR